MTQTPASPLLSQKHTSDIEGQLKSLVSTVLDTIVDGVITIDDAGIVQSYNKACAQLFGYTAEEMVGQNVRMLMPLPFRREHDQYLTNYHRSGHAKIIGIGREVSGQRKDGSIFPMELAVGQTTSGGKHAFVGIIRDITERREAEAAREQLRQSQKMEALGQLTSGIAHDFNNLLAVILGNLDFLREKLPPDSPLQDYVTPAIESSEHGAALTSQLLAFSRKQTLQPKLLSAAQIITHCSQLLKRTLNERIEVILQVSPDTGHINADPAMLENALLNLALNARDAMPGGGKLILETQNVRLDDAYARLHSEVTPGEYVLITISDTGCGMEKHVLEKAFEPFFTTKAVGSGTGLGLSMVYGFVKQSAGHIKLYSEPGHGTSVKIYLPRSNPTAHNETLLPNHRDTPQRPKRKHNVMVVEDNPQVLKLTEALVKSLGYCVVVATTGDEAWQLLQENESIDLLLTDVMLPGKINGPDLATLARGKYPQLKILFCSGYTESAMLHNGILEQGAELISKPFRLQQLASRMAALLDPAP